MDPVEVKMRSLACLKAWIQVLNDSSARHDAEIKREKKAKRMLSKGIRCWLE